jgi:alpha-tubulin suppressor-like RCC1 family protein
MEGMSVKLIAAGHYSLCVTRDDNLYIWGVDRTEAAPIKCSLQTRMKTVMMRHKSGSFDLNSDGDGPRR